MKHTLHSSQPSYSRRWPRCTQPSNQPHSAINHLVFKTNAVMVDSGELNGQGAIVKYQFEG
jgi:hypothetical protein